MAEWQEKLFFLIKLKFLHLVSCLHHCSIALIQGHIGHVEMSKHDTKCKNPKRIESAFIFCHSATRERKTLIHLPDSEVRQIPGFPNYLVSSSGEVFTAHRNFIPIAQNVNQVGIAHVGLYQDGQLHRRSVARLVADAFLDPPPFEHYGTLIHLDAEKTNCHVDNLAWRPRWFAMEYHHQYSDVPYPSYGDFPVAVPRYDQWFEHSFDFCMTYGALVRHVIDALMNFRPVPLLWIEVSSPTFSGAL